MKIKKGDNVLVISGKDRGRTAKVLKSLPKDLKVLIDGINLKNKHVKPKKQGEKGQVVKVPSPMDVSSVKFLCPKCGKAARLGYKVENPSTDSTGSLRAGSGRVRKFRVCKKCKSEV